MYLKKLCDMNVCFYRGNTQYAVKKNIAMLSQQTIYHNFKNVKPTNGFDIFLFLEYCTNKQILHSRLLYCPRHLLFLYLDKNSMRFVGILCIWSVV